MHQIQVKIRSRVMMNKMPVTILLPEECKDSKKLPVLWLLHGATETPEDLLSRCDLHRVLKDFPAMVVMPDGMNSDFADQPQFGTGYLFASFFMKELMPFIQNAFSGSSSRSDNVIAGYSMGGAGALMLGLNRPEHFSMIIPMGASVREYAFLERDVDLTGDEFRRKASSAPLMYPTEYGDPSQGITRKEINMISKYATVADYVKSMECTGKRFEEIPSEMLPQICFICGSEDGCCEKVKTFVDYAKILKTGKVEQIILPGIDHAGMKACVKKMIQYLKMNPEN